MCHIFMSSAYGKLVNIHISLYAEWKKKMQTKWIYVDTYVALLFFFFFYFVELLSTR